MNRPRVEDNAVQVGVASDVAMAKLPQLGEITSWPSTRLSPPVARKLRAALEADLPTVLEPADEARSVGVDERRMSPSQEKIAASGAIDGSVELSRELDRLRSTSQIAAEAPRGTGLAAYLARGLATEPVDGPAGEYTRLTESLLQKLSVWWSPGGYRRLPTMVPWCIRDRSARYDQGPESWGAPRDDGYFRDDNSIIKKLPLPVYVRAPFGHPYADRKPWRGFTACHIWRELPDGSVAGIDPWLYSFMPNLVWIPSPLSALSDMHELHVQRVLQQTSMALFRDVEAAPSVVPYADYAWSRLPAPPEGGRALVATRLALFEVDDAFIERRLKYLDSFASGAEQVLRTGALSRKLISSRYTAGLPLLDHTSVAHFRSTLLDYQRAVESAR